MTPKKHLILIGYRACGKTSTAVRLAGELVFPAVDSDVVIEQKADMSVTEIFTKYGEPYFRDLESETVAELLTAKQPLVLATGGGVPIRESNRKLLRQSGFVVWLQASPDVIFARMTADPTSESRRPGLTSFPPKEEILRLLEWREPFYKETAHCEICTDTISPEETARKILEKYHEFSAKSTP
ncbi:MAG: shikimate kinase [Planctomycetaceae bacterium]|nr:shikimate kinase [Planctomycetaceae bacterium]